MENTEGSNNNNNSGKNEGKQGRNLKLYIISGISILILGVFLIGGYLLYNVQQDRKIEAEKVSNTIETNSKIYQPLIESSKEYKDKFMDETDAGDYTDSLEKYEEFLEKLNQLSVENNESLEGYAKAKEAEILSSPNEETEEYAGKVESYINEGVDYHTKTGKVLDFYICVAEKDRNLFVLSEEMGGFDELDTSSRAVVLVQLESLKDVFIRFSDGISDYKTCFQGEYKIFGDEEVVTKLDEMAETVRGMSNDVDDMINAFNANNVAGVQEASMRISERERDLQFGSIDSFSLEKHVSEVSNRKLKTYNEYYYKALSELKDSENSLEKTYNLEIVPN